MPLVEFPYTLYKGYLMPIIPITILDHWVWVFVDSGATFTILSISEANRIGIDWQKGKSQMIVVGDGSFIPTYFHDLSIKIGEWKINAPIGFSDRLGVGFNLLGRTGIFEHFNVCFHEMERKITFQKL